MNETSDLSKFILGENNVVKTELMIEREVNKKTGQEFIHILSAEGKPIYTFWHNPNKENKTEKPKRTGGKKPYVMLMLKELEKFQESKVAGSEEMIGLLTVLSTSIEWNTGRLIKKRSKKPLRYSDIVDMVSFGKYKLNKVLTELKKNNLLNNTSEGYFISRELIKKGGR